MEEESRESNIHEIELDMLIELDRVCKKNNLKYYIAYGTILGAVRHKGFIPWDDDIDVIVDIDSYKSFCSIVRSEIAADYILSYTDRDPSYDSLKARISPKGKGHHTAYIDIFPLVGVPKSKAGRRLFIGICHIIYRSYFVKMVDVAVNYKDNKRKRIIAIILKLLLIPIPAGLIRLIFDKLSTMYTLKDCELVYNICGCYGYRELVPKEYMGEPVQAEFEGHSFPMPEKWDQYLTHLYGDYRTPKKKVK